VDYFTMLSAATLHLNLKGFWEERAIVLLRYYCGFSQEEMRENYRNTSVRMAHVSAKTVTSRSVPLTKKGMIDKMIGRDFHI
jgi:hypothetical protein